MHRISDDEAYKGRNLAKRPTVLDLDMDARRILTQYAPHRKSWGSFVSKLLHAEEVRIETRQEMQRRQTHK